MTVSSLTIYLRPEVKLVGRRMHCRKNVSRDIKCCLYLIPAMYTSFRKGSITCRSIISPKLAVFAGLTSCDQNDTDPRSPELHATYFTGVSFRSPCFVTHLPSHRSHNGMGLTMPPSRVSNEWCLRCGKLTCYCLFRRLSGRRGG